MVHFVIFLLINGSVVEGNQTKMTCRCFNWINVGTSFLEGVFTTPKNVNRQVPGTRRSVSSIFEVIVAAS